MVEFIVFFVLLRFVAAVVGAVVDRPYNTSK